MLTHFPFCFSSVGALFLFKILKESIKVLFFLFSQQLFFFLTSFIFLGNSVSKALLGVFVLLMFCWCWSSSEIHSPTERCISLPFALDPEFWFQNYFFSNLCWQRLSETFGLTCFEIQNLSDLGKAVSWTHHISCTLHMMEIRVLALSSRALTVL